jgi:DNA-binding MarR family transcriptional regulator
MAVREPLDDDDYARLLDFRFGLRTFLRWSEETAHKQGMTPTQHQLLLAIRGHRDPLGPTIGDAADKLLLKHHSAVELVDRAEAAGLLTRAHDPDDQRMVRLQLTETGAAKLEAITVRTLEKLDRMGDQLLGVWDKVHDE